MAPFDSHSPNPAFLGPADPRLPKTAHQTRPEVPRRPTQTPCLRAFVPMCLRTSVASSLRPDQGVQRKQKRGPLTIAVAKCVFYRSLRPPRGQAGQNARRSATGVAAGVVFGSFDAADRADHAPAAERDEASGRLHTAIGPLDCCAWRHRTCSDRNCVRPSRRSPGASENTEETLGAAHRRKEETALGGLGDQAKSDSQSRR